LHRVQLCRADDLRHAVAPVDACDQRRSLFGQIDAGFHGRHAEFRTFALGDGLCQRLCRHAAQMRNGAAVRALRDVRVTGLWPA
jgi:hypothetical protein